MPRSTRNPRLEHGPSGYTPDWPLVRLRVLIARGYTCERCGDQDLVAQAQQAPATLLQVHHHDRDKRNNDPGNLEVLCRRCHCTEHGIAWYPHWPRKRPRGRGRLRVRMLTQPAEGEERCGS